VPLRTWDFIWRKTAGLGGIISSIPALRSSLAPTSRQGSSTYMKRCAIWRVRVIREKNLAFERQEDFNR